MGATDLGDQLAAAYRSRLKTLSWIPRIFTHFLSHATVNMYAIAKYIRSIPNQDQFIKDLIPAGHLNFRLCLIDALMKPYVLQHALHEAPVARVKICGKLTFLGFLALIFQFKSIPRMSKGLKARRDLELKEATLETGSEATAKFATN